MAVVVTIASYSVSVLRIQLPPSSLTGISFSTTFSTKFENSLRPRLKRRSADDRTEEPKNRKENKRNFICIVKIMGRARAREENPMK